MKIVMRHRYSVWIDVSAESGDGWSRYPDYSQAEVTRMLCRALHKSLEFDAVVEHAETVEIEE